MIQTLSAVHVPVIQHVLAAAAACLMWRLAKLHSIYSVWLHTLLKVHSSLQSSA